MKKLLKNRPWIKYYNEVPYSINYPDISMFELIKQTSIIYPYNTAYEYYGKLCNYKRFIVKIEEAAKGFKALGINKGDRVTVCMPNTPQGIISFYALNMIGAIAVMIHPLSSENEIEFYINKTESKIILTIDIVFEKINKVVGNTCAKKVIVAPISVDMKLARSFLYWITKGRKHDIGKTKNIITWNEFIDQGYEYLGKVEEKTTGNDPAIILFSGGTTGKPKAILLSNLNFNAQAMQSHLMCDPSKEGDSILSIMPIFHGFGLAVCIHTPLYTGMKCILIPDFSSKKFYKLIKKYKPNFLVGVPTLFESLINNKKIGKSDLSCVTCLVSGGDSLSAALKHKVDDFLFNHGCSAEVRQGYGLTESSGASCLSPTGNYRNNSIGIPFPDTIYKIVKLGTHEEADADTDGEICISGPTIMMGYLGDEKETISTIQKHGDGITYLHTGDIGSMDEDGYVYFKQRLKRMIVSSGYNIYPSHIEEIINNYPKVLACTVIGVPHPYKVQVAKAFIVLKDNIKPSDSIKKEIKNYCKKNIASYSLPYEYEFRTSIPKTLVGKVAYTKLEEDK
ncbi:MAG: AMP-binding protein [Bacilli bacterium]